MRDNQYSQREQRAFADRAMKITCGICSTQKHPMSVGSLGSRPGTDPCIRAENVACTQGATHGSKLTRRYDSVLRRAEPAVREGTPPHLPATTWSPSEGIETSIAARATPSSSKVATAHAIHRWIMFVLMGLTRVLCSPERETGATAHTQGAHRQGGRLLKIADQALARGGKER